MVKLTDLPSQVANKVQESLEKSVGKYVDRGAAELHYARKMFEAGALKLESPQHIAAMLADIVRWALYAMIEAEEYGITSKNVDEMLKSENPSIKRILGVTPGMGKALGVDEKWVYNIVKQVGNYGESYDRHVGPATPLKLERGQNALWTNGGLMYAIPFR